MKKPGGGQTCPPEIPKFVTNKRKNKLISPARKLPALLLRTGNTLGRTRVQVVWESYSDAGSVGIVIPCFRTVKSPLRKNHIIFKIRFWGQGAQTSSGRENGYRLRSRMVRLAGIEPATCGFEVRRSILLSYRRIKEKLKKES